jgi:hypothetical protein
VLGVRHASAEHPLSEEDLLLVCHTPTQTAIKQRAVCLRRVHAQKPGPADSELTGQADGISVALARGRL